MGLNTGEQVCTEPNLLGLLLYLQLSLFRWIASMLHADNLAILVATSSWKLFM